jgi:CheY-like chemotaxis protein
MNHYALWNRKQKHTVPESRRVLVAHADRSLGESLTALFALKGFPAEFAGDATTLHRKIRAWRPQVILLDTRIGGCGNYTLVNHLRAMPDVQRRLIIAMSGFLPEEPLNLLKEAGYDGHCRRPCPVWQLTDLLDEFFCLRDDAVK